MPNLTEAQPQSYAPPFLEDRFYLIPLPWLHAVVEAGALDARALLLAQVVDGADHRPVVIFDEMSTEQVWYAEVETARPFFTRRTYERHRKRLVAQGLLRKYRPASPPAGVTKVAWQDLQQGIKYTVASWPGDAWIYCPRPYLTNRWPIWLGNSDVASRLIVLALLAEAGRLAGAGGTPLSTQVTLSWRQLCAFVEQRLGDAPGRPLSAQMISAQIAGKLRKGIQELMVLSAVDEMVGSPLRYALSLPVFDQPPQWSIPAMAQACQADSRADGLCLELVRDLMNHCWEPVTRLKRVWNAVQAGRRSATLLDETDLLDLQKFLRTQRHQGPPPRHDHVLQAFLRQRQPTSERLVGDLFLLTAQAIMVAQFTANGNPIVMPVATVHGLAATQLWIRCECTGGLTVAEAQEILVLTRLLIWQERADAGPVTIPLLCHKPRTLSIDFGYVLRANQLHGQLDYAQPFEVILRCHRPDPRLKLHCRFRLLLRQANLTPLPPLLT
jgi:hypothetical protein